MKAQVMIEGTRILSDKKYSLKEIVFSLQEGPAAGKQQQREVYERRDAAVILLYNKKAGTVILTRQFRLPAFLHGNSDGWLTECCAGVMEEEDAEACIRRETLEETGYRIHSVEKVMEAYMSPAALTEYIYFFTAPYDSSMKEGQGGGLAEEQEYIEVLELPFEQAYGMVASGGLKDAKTIMLLQYARLKGLF